MSYDTNIDIVLLTREMPTAELLEFYGSCVEDPMTTIASADGATASVFYPEGGLAVVLAVPKFVEHEGDLARVLGVAPRDLPAGVRFWTEGVASHRDPNLGLAIAGSVSQHCGGRTVLRVTGDMI